MSKDWTYLCLKAAVGTAARSFFACHGASIGGLPSQRHEMVLT
jgi:hypothetical protein